MRWFQVWQNFPYLNRCPLEINHHCRAFEYMSYTAFALHLCIFEIFGTYPTRQNLPHNLRNSPRRVERVPHTSWHHCQNHRGKPQEAFDWELLKTLQLRKIHSPLKIKKKTRFFFNSQIWRFIMIPNDCWGFQKKTVCFKHQASFWTNSH